MTELEITQAALSAAQKLSGQNDRTLLIFLGGVLIVGLIFAVRYLANHANRLQTRGEQQTEKIVEVAVTCRTAIESNTEVMKKVIDKVMPNLKLITLAFITVTLTAWVGCAHLDAGADPVIVRAEQTIRLADSSMELALNLDDSNREFYKAKVPEFHTFCSWLRVKQPVNGTNLPRATVLILDATDLKNAYKTNKANKDLLESSLLFLLQVNTKATKWLSDTNIFNPTH